MENHSLPWIQSPGLKFPFILLFLPLPSKCPATEMPSTGRKFKLGFPGCTGVYRNNIKCPLSASRVGGGVSLIPPPHSSPSVRYILHPHNLRHRSSTLTEAWNFNFSMRCFDITSKYINKSKSDKNGFAILSIEFLDTFITIKIIRIIRLLENNFFRERYRYRQSVDSFLPLWIIV